METEDFRESWLRGELVSRHLKQGGERLVVLPLIEPIKNSGTKELMMSKDEIKQEYKQSEGDPTIKSKRKQLHQELVMSDATENTKKASVLVTNPTHYAIAIYYEKGETR